MCGICGIVTGPGSARVVRREAVERMRDTIFHRGPDGEGLFLDSGVGLGHRRLSIVDVARGAQPMASDGGQLQLFFNGEI
jgi:asparagine synthase (glutamine-hydrolysing)